LLGGPLGGEAHHRRESFACPRQESNLRTWFRKPLLYPLSYGGAVTRVAPCNELVPGESVAIQF
jgi:hypothetical protein